MSFQYFHGEKRTKFSSFGYQARGFTILSNEESTAKMSLMDRMKKAGRMVVDTGAKTMLKVNESLVSISSHINVN
jgi:hypothetical protein